MTDPLNKYLQESDEVLEEESSLFSRFKPRSPKEDMTDFFFQEMLLNLIEFREILGDATTTVQSRSTFFKFDENEPTEEDMTTKSSSKLLNKDLLSSEKSISKPSQLQVIPDNDILSSETIVYEEQTASISTFREKIAFTNGNIYEGETENRLMHGIGKFCWSDGTVYEGEFRNGYPNGKGRMVISDLSVYEGHFCDGYFHGEGNYNLVATQLIYTGQWKNGKKHGRGWLQYAPNNWYEGEWLEDLREGVGVRYYKKCCKYKGNWFRNQKHGKGEMIWENGDYYCGEWKNDKPNGYGEYTWSMVYNDTFTFPCYTFYKGSWLNGLRDGVGLLNFGTECGAKLAGTWRRNEKDGPGLMVCGNGLIIASNPLFIEDKPVTKPQQKILRNPLQVSYEETLYRTIVKLVSSKENIQEFDSDIVRRIADLSTITTAGRFTELVDPNKKIWFCLEIPIHTVTENVDLQYYIDIIVNHYYSQIQNVSPSFRTICESNSESCLQELFRQIRKREKLLLKNVITVFLPKLKDCYDYYARLTTKKSLAFTPVLIRLFLWQMLRDIQFFNYTSLVEADLLFSRNPASCAETDHYPFEHIYFWQFVQYLVGCSWLAHLKRDFNHSINVCELTTGISTFIFKTFLVKDVFPHYMTFQGTALDIHRNMLPVKNLYALYLYVGQSHSVRTFLHCTVDEKPLCCYNMYNEFNRIPKGFNSVPVGDKIFYIKEKSDDVIPKPPQPAYSEEDPDPFFRSLYTFRNLGRKTVIKCIAQICPKIKLGKKNRIDMSYKINFLEFWEILLLCAYEKAEQKRIQISNTVKISQQSRLKASSLTRSSIRTSKGDLTRKRSKKSIGSGISAL